MKSLKHKYYKKHDYYCLCIKCQSLRAFCKCERCQDRRKEELRTGGRSIDDRDFSKYPSMQQLVDLSNK
tara:strand:- start:475 stop:681 length:207 start_codon:yes stop_codon:yes gene_type:complete